MPEYPMRTEVPKAPSSADDAIEAMKTKFENIKVSGTATVGPVTARIFETGATRDTDDGKFDYEGFLSPLVIERFGAYMHENRKMKNGSLRDSDNWQKGIPPAEYMKSLWRHFHHVWKLHREEVYNQTEMEDALCGVMFNAMGYLHSLLNKDK